MLGKSVAGLGIVALACIAVGCTTKDKIYCDDHPDAAICMDGSMGGCTANVQCATASASKCDITSKTCVGCAEDAECTHISGKGVCDNGRCVECTDSKDTGCAGKVCDVKQRTCSTAAPSTSQACQTCVSDKQCLAEHRCVPMNFQGTARTEAYCLKDGSQGGCSRPYTVLLTDRQSISGLSGATYCGIDETKTSCEAVLDLVNDTECAGGQDTECGAPGLNDGLCKTVNLVTNRCTYPCSGAAECRMNVDCNTYCGGSAGGSDAGM